MPPLHSKLSIHFFFNSKCISSLFSWLNDHFYNSMTITAKALQRQGVLIWSSVTTPSSKSPDIFRFTASQNTDENRTPVTTQVHISYLKLINIPHLPGSTLHVKTHTLWTGLQGTAMAPRDNVRKLTRMGHHISIKTFSKTSTIKYVIIHFKNIFLNFLGAHLLLDNC